MLASSVMISRWRVFQLLLTSVLLPISSAIQVVVPGELDYPIRTSNCALQSMWINELRPSEYRGEPLRIIAGCQTSAITSSARSPASVSPFPLISISNSDLSVCSPFDRKLTETVLLLAFHSPENFVEQA
jgi:hypothetical protein